MEFITGTWQTFTGYIDAIDNKPRFLSFVYASSALWSGSFLICCFTAMGKCLYEPCLEGHGIDMLTKVHFGLSYEMFLYGWLFLFLAIYALFVLRVEGAMSMSYWPFTTLLGATGIMVVVSFQQGLMWGAMGDIVHNLKIHGDVEESRRESDVVDLQPQFDAMAVFSHFLLVTYGFAMFLMNRYADEEANHGRDRAVPPGSTIIASSLPTGNPYATMGGAGSAGRSYQEPSETTTI